MKNIKDFDRFINESKKALLITIPKSIKWEDYMKEINAVEDESQEMNYRVSSRPNKVGVGDRCYLCHNGFIKGWMKISNISKKKFQCTTTGKDWEEGWYVSRTGEFHPLEKEVPQKGFMGYKYIDEI